MRKFHLIWVGILLAGCGQFPNPNDISAINPESRVEIANKRLEAAQETLQYKVSSREINDERRNELISEIAEEMLKSIEPKVIPDSDQWMYAALLRVTNRWPEAEKALEVAVSAAKTEDRRINDILKLAVAQAKNKKIAEAISTASKVLDAKDEDAAPILPSVLYEVVPAAQGKGHDKELMILLEKAIECHKRVKVDPKTDQGKLFIAASRHHIGIAETKVIELAGTQI